MPSNKSFGSSGLDLFKRDQVESSGSKKPVRGVAVELQCQITETETDERNNQKLTNC
jgi:hypothetical protein